MIWDFFFVFFVVEVFLDFLVFDLIFEFVIDFFEFELLFFVVVLDKVIFVLGDIVMGLKGLVEMGGFFG